MELLWRFAAVCVLFSLILTAAAGSKTDGSSVEPLTEKNFDFLYSAEDLGFNREDGRSVFRLFAPRAKEVNLHLYRRPDGRAFKSLSMERNDKGIWSVSLKRRLWRKYYDYSLIPGDVSQTDYPADTRFADPYSKNVTTRNHYGIHAKSYICRNYFSWSDQNWKTPADPRDLIIYEAQLRDMSAHSSAASNYPGTYAGFAGKIDYLKSVGVNAVEFLPLHDFANIEIPYRDSSTALFNTWNPYERNHWGYMSTFFFSPENYYSSVGHMRPDERIDDRGKSQKEFKALVNLLHNHGFAVLMDVVYNHTSTYDPISFKCIDKDYYYRQNADGTYTSVSGCGNDFKTERPMARKLIIDSIVYWMTEYHIDGFRFDLAALIDDVTLKEIIRTAREINPNVIIIAEPWGGTYNPDHFSDLDWSSWNDQFRNGIKGQNPHTRKGFIFGNWDDGTTRKNAIRYLMGSLRDDGGQYVETAHSVNYLASHDDHTFGDFVRLALDLIEENEVVEDRLTHGTLSDKEMTVHTLGAFILASSQGVTMIHAGQEYGRSKVIEVNAVPDNHQGRIDHNSYNKDNSTNYLNYDIAEINEELIDIYKKFFEIRKEYPELRKTPRDQLSPFYADSEFGIGYRIRARGKTRELLVLVNGSHEKPAYYSLPNGSWKIVTQTSSQIPAPAGISYLLPPASGVILELK